MTRKQPTERNSGSEQDKSNESELYGYGVVNTEWNQFVGILGGGHRGQTIHVCSPSFFDSARDRVKKHYLEVTEGMDDTSHLRIVEVRLSPTLDADAEETRQRYTEVRE